MRVLKAVVIFEGRDDAGKGGVIKKTTEPLNPCVWANGNIYLSKD
jgi:polyphosphate kinase 2 (PPK2 family)